MKDAGVESADALFVGNMLSGALIDQEHLATLVAGYCGLYGIEAAKVEAACASGAAALRVGAMAVASGYHEVVIVAGLEKMTDTVGKDTTAGLATASDAEYEALHGVTFVGLNALIMQRYMHEYQVPLDAFAGFSINAHRNGANNPNAMFQEAIDRNTYLNAPIIATPINMMDSSPVSDGSAAVVLVPTERVKSFTDWRIIGGLCRFWAAPAPTTRWRCMTGATRSFLPPPRLAAKRLCDRPVCSGRIWTSFELHDAFTIMSALSLEANGFAKRGEGWRMAQDETIGLQGDLPISTMGGLKSRGHPVGRDRHLSNRRGGTTAFGPGRGQPNRRCPDRHGAEYRRKRGNDHYAYIGRLI